MTAMSVNAHAPMMVFTAVFLVGTMIGLVATMARVIRRIG